MTLTTGNSHIQLTQISLTRPEHLNGNGRHSDLKSPGRYEYQEALIVIQFLFLLHRASPYFFFFISLNGYCKF